MQADRQDISNRRMHGSKTTMERCAASSLGQLHNIDCTTLAIATLPVHLGETVLHEKYTNRDQTLQIQCIVQHSEIVLLHPSRKWVLPAWRPSLVHSDLQGQKIHQSTRIVANLCFVSFITKGVKSPFEPLDNSQLNSDKPWCCYCRSTATTCISPVLSKMSLVVLISDAVPFMYKCLCTHSNALTYMVPVW